MIAEQFGTLAHRSGAIGREDSSSCIAGLVRHIAGSITLGNSSMLQKKTRTTVFQSSDGSSSWQQVAFRIAATTRACLVLVFVAWLALLLGVGCNGPATTELAEEQAANTSTDGEAKTVAGTVRLTIDFRSAKHDHDLENIQVDIPCSADSTVLAIMQRAQNLGDVSLKYTGKGELVFVSAIGGVSNLGGGGDNWVFSVNDQLGDKSCGVFPVKPGDRVLWVFGKYP